MLGDTISHYKILRKLGEGGMGEVFLARDTELDRDVALKVLRSETATQQDRLLRFRREAKAVAALNHPYIVTIYSVEAVDDTHFLTMEYVDGPTLAELTPKNGFTLEKFFDFAIPLAEALTAAHEHGIVHRDLKPSNVMVDRSGRVRVLDFGLAKLMESRSQPTQTVDTKGLTDTLTADGRIVGTTPFMSPEQLKGQPLDARSDIFALGVVLYMMATGNHPFTRDSSAEVISAILTEEPPRVSEFKPALPRHLGRMIRHCLEKDPSHRFQTALDVRNELVELREEVARGEAPSDSESIYPVPPKDRRTLRPWVIGTAVVLAVLLGSLVLVRWVRRPATALQSVAVMPFANLTGDPAKEHVGMALSAGLISKLRQIPGVQLASRSEAWSYLDAGLSATELGAELGIGGVIDGELQETDPLIRASVSLTDAYTGFVLWSESYAVDPDGLFELQDQIARGLATFLSIPLSVEDRERLAKNPTGSVQAYDYYVEGQRLLDLIENPDSPDLAAENFKQALRIDPEFGLAHVGLSEALWRVYHRDFDQSALEDAVRSAEEAVRIDPNLPEAQLAVARVYRSTGRSSNSIEELSAVLARHPKPDEALRELAISYEVVGDLDQAEEALRGATALAPENWLNWNTLGMTLASHGKYPEAREAFERTLELAPSGATLPYENLATIDLAEGRIDDAIEAYEKIPGPIRDGRLATNIGTAYFFSDRADKWQKVEEYYRLAVQLRPRDAINRANLGDLYAQLERSGEARESYRIARDLTEEELAQTPQDLELRSRMALYSAKAQDCDTALEGTAPPVDADQDTARLAHRRGYIFALCDRSDKAIQALRQAIALGESPEIIRQEREFQELRKHPDFVALVGD